MAFLRRDPSEPGFIDKLKAKHAKAREERAAESAASAPDPATTTAATTPVAATTPPGGGTKVTGSHGANPPDDNKGGCLKAILIAILAAIVILWLLMAAVFDWWPFDREDASVSSPEVTASATITPSPAATATATATATPSPAPSNEGDEADHPIGSLPWNHPDNPLFQPGDGGHYPGSDTPPGSSEDDNAGDPAPAPRDENGNGKFYEGTPFEKEHYRTGDDVDWTWKESNEVGYGAIADCRQHTAEEVVQCYRDYPEELDEFLARTGISREQALDVREWEAFQANKDMTTVSEFRGADGTKHYAEFHDQDGDVSWYHRGAGEKLIKDNGGDRRHAMKAVHDADCFNDKQDFLPVPATEPPSVGKVYEYTPAPIQKGTVTTVKVDTKPVKDAPAKVEKTEVIENKVMLPQPKAAKPDCECATLVTLPCKEEQPAKETVKVEKVVVEKHVEIVEIIKKKVVTVIEDCKEIITPKDKEPAPAPTPTPSGAAPSAEPEQPEVPEVPEAPEQPEVPEQPIDNPGKLPSDDPEQTGDAPENGAPVELPADESGETIPAGDPAAPEADMPADTYTPPAAPTPAPIERGVVIPVDNTTDGTPAGGTEGDTPADGSSDPAPVDNNTGVIVAPVEKDAEIPPNQGSPVEAPVTEPIGGDTCAVCGGGMTDTEQPAPAPAVVVAAPAPAPVAAVEPAPAVVAPVAPAPVVTEPAPAPAPAPVVVEPAPVPAPAPEIKPDPAPAPVDPPAPVQMVVAEPAAPPAVVVADASASDPAVGEMVEAA